MKIVNTFSQVVKLLINIINSCDFNLSIQKYVMKIMYDKIIKLIHLLKHQFHSNS